MPIGGFGNIRLSKAQILSQAQDEGLGLEDSLLYRALQKLYISYMKIRQQLQFFGRVQGVGFRWTAKQIANHLGMTGWAFNEDDGSVTVELQGEEELFPKFMKLLDKNLFISIDQIKKTPLPLEQENYFYIKDE